MPRQAHGRPLLKADSSVISRRKPRQNAALNALETAERQNPYATKIPQHRLGEVEDDSDAPELHRDEDERSSKRQKFSNNRNEDEDVMEGSDLEGGIWHTGVDGEDEDSDLDSDDAFGQSDEEKFADFTFRGSGTKKSGIQNNRTARSRDIDLNENIDDRQGDNNDAYDLESDDLGGDAIDLATAWDLDDIDHQEHERTTAKEAGRKAIRGRDDASDSGETHAVSEEESESESEAMDENSQFSLSEDEMDGDVTGLRTFIETLSSSGTERRPKQHSDPISLSNEPSRFGVPPSKLSAADLLQYVKDPVQRQSLKILQNAERIGPEDYKGGIPGKLSAPLAKRQQDKLNRNAAYEKSKETLNQWIDTVKQNRRAEHLSFPLTDHVKRSMLGQKQLMPTNQSMPANDLETKIHEIMQESGMNHSKGQSAEDHEQAFEELAEKKMDIDSVNARRAELRMARELMFREEVRAKRIKKIKSKAFRRVHRKDKDRLEAQQREALGAAGLLNSDEERDKQDRRRAEQRMGARHRESKWAKGIKEAGRAAWDVDARAGVTDLAKRDEDLRRRILGKDVVDPEASDIDSDSETDYEADTDAEEQNFAAKLDKLESIATTNSTSKLGQMTFMQRAEAAKKNQNDEEIRQLRLALSDKVDAVDANGADYQEQLGRQKFGVRAGAKPAQLQPKKARNEFEARLTDDDDDNDDDHDHAEVNGNVNQETGTSVDNGPKKVTQVLAAKSQAGITQNLTTEPKNTPRKPVNHQTSQDQLPRAPVQQHRSTEKELHDHTSTSESEYDGNNDWNADETKAALAASIFAGPDDTVKAFAKEKAEIVEEEGDQVIDNTLPGWGSWTGAGISKREQRKGKGRFLTAVKGVAPEHRRDAKLDRVIINEKRVKKNGKYLATELPHPFETRQQYERSLRLPIGPEWSTANHYQDSIKPRVLLKQGTVIRPIAKPTA